LSDGRKKKYIEMFGSFAEPFNFKYWLSSGAPYQLNIKSPTTSYSPTFMVCRTLTACQLNWCLQFCAEYPFSREIRCQRKRT